VPWVVALNQIYGVFSAKSLKAAESVL